MNGYKTTFIQIDGKTTFDINAPWYKKILYKYRRWRIKINEST